MRRFFLVLLAAALIPMAAHAGFNIKQNDDGSTCWVQSLGNVGGQDRCWTPQGDHDVSQRVVWSDDFLGDALADEYELTSGSDAQAVDPAISAAVGGTVALASGNAGTGVAADASALALGLNWESDQGNLVLEARCKLDDITDVIVNIGFTDVMPGTTLEIPLEYNTTTITSTASDAVAFVFDTGATTDNWHAIGVAGDTETSAINTGLAPTANTYQTFRVEVDSSERANFYIDGALVAQLGSVLTGTDDITPVIIIVADTTDQATLTCDYVTVAGDRS